MWIDVTGSSFKAVGDGKTDNFEAINNALNEAGANGDTVYIPAGKYVTSQPLVVPPGVNVKSDAGTVILPSDNFDVVQIGSDSEWCGGIINTFKVGTRFTSACIAVKPNMSMFTTTYALSTKVSRVKLFNHGTGSGLSLEIAQNTTRQAIEYGAFDNIFFDGCDTAIHITGDGGWINACDFNVLRFLFCKNGIVIDHKHSGHTFTGIQFQSHKDLNRIIDNSGVYNNFSGMIWDFSGYIPTPKPIIVIEQSAKNTTFDVNIDPKSGYVQDAGANTTWR